MGSGGTANIEPVTAETALKLGGRRACVQESRSAVARPRKHKIVIGRTPAFPDTCSKTLFSGHSFDGCGRVVYRAVPTPGVAYATRSLRADAGIVLTASHNPYDDNGIKFFGADGYKLADDIENKIGRTGVQRAHREIRRRGEIASRPHRRALGRYIEYAKASFPRGLTLEGLRIVVDCAHGAAYKSTPVCCANWARRSSSYGDHPAARTSTETAAPCTRKDVVKVREQFGAPRNCARRR